MDLSEEEYRAFGNGIAALAAQRERKPRQFEAFQAFLHRAGPFGCVVDGANAALFGQNWEEGGFSFAQVEAVVAQLQQERPDLTPLVVRRQASPRFTVCTRELAYLRDDSSFQELQRKSRFLEQPMVCVGCWSRCLHRQLSGAEKA